MSKKWMAFLTLVITVLIFGVLNYIVGGLGMGNVRADLTQDKLYSLSDATKALLGKLKDDRQVKIRLYASDDSRVVPSQLTEYARNVEDFLLNLVSASNGKLVLEKFAPNPDTEDEDKAIADEITGMPVSQEAKVYLGLAIQSLQQKEVIGFLSPDDEPRLEYEIVRAIRKVNSPKLPVIGVMSSLPVTGGKATPQMMMQGQQGPRAWLTIEQLKADYEVKTVETTAEKIDDDIKTLIVIQPSSLPDRAEWAIDQFVLRGGRLIAFLDPNCLTAAAAQPRNPMMMMAPPQTSSSFKYLLKNWGVTWDPTQIVADQTYRSGSGSPPAFMELEKDAVQSEFSATAQLGKIMMFEAGAFNYDKTEGLTKTALIQSSPNNELIDSARAESSRRSGEVKGFMSSGKRQTLALRITGKFKSAFPGGTQPPKAAPQPDPENPGAPPPPPADPNEKPLTGLAESASSDGVVFLISDVDMLSDQGLMRSPDAGQQPQLNNNLALVLNIVEQAAMQDGIDLSKIRSRASFRRPFTKMNELQEEIDAQYRPQTEMLQTKLSETSQAMGAVKITEKNGELQLLMTPEQVKKRDELVKTMGDLRQQKRELNNKRTREMDSLQSRIKWSNILIVPALVAMVGAFAAIIRRRRTAAA